VIVWYCSSASQNESEVKKSNAWKFDQQLKMRCPKNRNDFAFKDKWNLSNERDLVKHGLQDLFILDL